MSSDSNEGVILRGLRSLLECTQPFPSHMASIRLAIIVLLAGAAPDSRRSTHWRAMRLRESMWFERQIPRTKRRHWNGSNGLNDKQIGSILRNQALVPSWTIKKK
jgi:hypothetical protein